MRNFTILIVLVGFTALTYFGIEPYAHSVMHPHTSPADYEFKDLKAMPGKGDTAAGKEKTLMNCVACHAIEGDNIPKPVSKEELIAQYGLKSNVDLNFERLSNEYLGEMHGVVPLDLSNVGGIYNEKFLKNFIKYPAATAFESTYILHKKSALNAALADADATGKAKLQKEFDADIIAYKEKNKIAMPNHDWLPDQDIIDIVAYLKSISKELTPKEATELACVRCHSIKYDNVEAQTPAPILKKYLGTTPPDLSQMIKSRSEHYLTVFINDPQKVLIGSSMPRVGLNKVTEDKVVAYLENVGDSSKEKRESMGIYVILFFVIFTIFAYFFKVNAFKDVH
jgi:ubiquinol-cytochrome c reductase cytochrome c1 subunit